jgi:hypothetical protein
MHNADRDMFSLEKTGYSNCLRSPAVFLQRYCAQHGGKSEPDKLYLLRFESLTS